MNLLSPLSSWVAGNASDSTCAVLYDGAAAAQYPILKRRERG